MRAMPSLTEVITPSWASTTGASKLAILAFRISLISSLRMAIVTSISTRARARPACWSCERGPKLLQPCPHTAVDDPVADADDQAAEDLWILPHRGLHLRAEPIGEALLEALGLLVAHRHRRGDLGADHAGGAVGEAPVMGQHRGERRQPAALQEQAHQVGGLRRGALQQRAGQLHALRLLEPRVVQGAEHRRIAEGLGHALQLTAPLLGLAGLVGEVEVGLRVAARDRLGDGQLSLSARRPGGAHSPRVTSASDSSMSFLWVLASIA